MSSLRILMLHNRYKVSGGEDISTQNETTLLRDGGYDVDLVEYDNKLVDQIGHMATAMRTIWSIPAVRDIRQRLQSKQYDILHVQNYFPLISPAVIYTASQMGVKTVQSLRNYRLVCANAQLFRDGKSCTQCLGKTVPWHGIINGCYRNSKAGSLAIAAMIGVHKLLGTWHHKTSAFIAISDYVRNIYIKGGFPENRIHTKPNILAYQPKAAHYKRLEQIACVGRLTSEKGVDTLIQAWINANGKQYGKLIIAGTGPEEQNLKALAAPDLSIKFLGHISQQEVQKLMAQSQAIVIPSLWGEPFGRAAIEAFSVGTPVLGAASGGLQEILANGQTGEIFPPGDTNHLSQLIQKIFQNNNYREVLQQNSQKAFNTTYAPSAILKRTEEIYQKALS